MKIKEKIGNLPLSLFSLILCIFYGAMFSGSLLGILGWYQRLPAIMVTLGMALGLFFFLNCRLLPVMVEKFFQVDTSLLPKTVDWVIYSGSIILIISLFLYPVAFWPRTVAGNWFPWDAGLYHFPKAVELFRTGSMNDMSIPYNEYPIGYESMLALCLALTQNDILFGWMHAFINLFFILAMWILAIRHTKIPPSLILFLIVIMILSGVFIKSLNIWSVFRQEITTVGKNDLFAAATVVSLLVFFPLGKNKKNIFQLIPPFCISSMMTLSVKPNVAVIPAALWANFLFYIIKHRKTFREEEWEELKKSLRYIPFIIPGGLWIIRNLIYQGEIFSKGALAGSQSSIIYNLFNQFFLQNIPNPLKVIIVLVLLIVTLGVLNLRNYRFHAYITILLFLVLLITPYVLVFEYKDTPIQFNMRFAEALIAYIFIVILEMLENTIKSIIRLVMEIRFARFILNIGFVLGFAGMLYALRGMMRFLPHNEIIRKDQFREAVGINGYYSAYDYVQKNIRNSIVWVENGLPYYVYGPGYTNSISRRSKPDYIVVIKTNWFGLGDFERPRYFPSDWRDRFEIVYEDQQAVVVKR